MTNWINQMSDFLIKYMNHEIKEFRKETCENFGPWVFKIQTLSSGYYFLELNNNETRIEFWFEIIEHPDHILFLNTHRISHLEGKGNMRNALLGIETVIGKIKKIKNKKTIIRFKINLRHKNASKVARWLEKQYYILENKGRYHMAYIKLIN